MRHRPYDEEDKEPSFSEGMIATALCGLVLAMAVGFCVVVWRFFAG